MSEDWRVELRIEGHGGPRRLLDAAREHTVAREARGRLGDRVVVTLDRDLLFAYTSTRDEAEAAAAELGSLAGAHGLEAQADVQRWHPVEEAWEGPDVALPATDEQEAAERARLDAGEDADSAAWGHPEWEVRVELPGHEETVALAERLKAEGHGVLRRSRYVLVGAGSEDEAGALAERLRRELPPAAKVTAEGSEALAWAQLHPFSWLGGLGN